MNSTVISLSTELHLHALEAGPADGPLVVLLHGFPEFSESWRDVMPVLVDAGFRVLAPDLRGYGRSDRPRSGYDIDTLADDIAQFIALTSRTGRAHVVGHDWGGAIAYHLAAFHPERVDRLAVVNAPHPIVLARRVWQPEQLVRSWYIFFFQLPWLPEYVLTRKGGRPVSALIRKSMVDASHFPHDRAALYAENFTQEGVARSAVGYYRDTLRKMLDPRRIRRTFAGYPRIRAPFRLIWGEEDMALSRLLTENLDAYFVHKPEVDYLPGVGHFSTIEAPEKVAALLVEHLSTHRDRNASTEHATELGAS